MKNKVKVVVSIIGKFIPFKNRFPRQFKKLLPILYISVLLISLVLLFVYAFVPSFVICTSLFGQRFCTPTGIFLALFVSLPGYLIAGNLLAIGPELPWLFSLISVILLSGVFYYLVGLLLDKKRGRKMTVELMTKVIIYASLVILLFLLLTLIPT